jgi:hypothetical protein
MTTSRQRRAAANQGGKSTHPEKMGVRVDSAVLVVPFDTLETYYRYEIAREGKWRANVPVVVMDCDLGRAATEEWFNGMLEDMRGVRAKHGASLFPIEGAGPLDIGCIDIRVHFHAPIPKQMNAADLARVQKENFHHFDMQHGDTFDVQCMTMAYAAHLYQADGSMRLHCHNLIFNLRKEHRDGILEGPVVTGPLDLDPMLRALAVNGSLRVIGGILN